MEVSIYRDGMGLIRLDDGIGDMLPAGSYWLTKVELWDYADNWWDYKGDALVAELAAQGETPGSMGFTISHDAPPLTDKDPFAYMGEGECRQADGQYPLKFSIGFGDLTPHTEGDNAQQAVDRCQSLCDAEWSWCFAAEVVTRDIWDTPECRLVTDRATFESSMGALQNNEWGGQQQIDGDNYQTYCGGNGRVTTRIGREAS